MVKFGVVVRIPEGRSADPPMVPGGRLGAGIKKFSLMKEKVVWHQMAEG